MHFVKCVSLAHSTLRSLRSTHKDTMCCRRDREGRDRVAKEALCAQILGKYDKSQGLERMQHLQHMQAFNFC